MTGTLAALFKLAGAGFVLAREGAFGLVDPAELPAGARAAIRIARLIERRGISAVDRGERLTAALNRLGPSYVKLGQFLATRPDLIGQEGAEALGKLRDEIAPFSEDEARASVARALGKPVEDLFGVLLAADRRRLDRPGPQGGAGDRGGQEPHGGGQGAAPRHPPPLPRRPRAPSMWQRG